jgi:outer membrane receptor protein involved in Fe transport
MHRNGIFRARLACLFVAVLLAAGVGAYQASGQGITTGAVSGTVVDSSGAVIQGATITAVNTGTDARMVQQSRADGTFTLVNLPGGNYTITIEATGFEKLSISQITVAVGETQIGPQKLKIGSSTVVQVEGDETPLLTTTQAQVSNTISADQIQSLPFGGGFDTAALLSPGVVITHDNSFSNNNGAYGGFSSQGQRGRSNNFEIDGQSNNDNSVAGPQVFFSNPDAIDSIQVITNNFSAQYGRNAGSILNYITRSGSNHFHGTVFEWYEGNWGESFAQGQKSPFLGYCPPDAISSSCVTPTLPRYVDNDFGGSFGGPLWKDKLFFFSSALFNRYRNGGGTSISTPSLTPTPDGLATLKAAFPNAPGVAALVNNGPYSIKTGNPQPLTELTQTVPVTYGGNTVDVAFAPISRSVPSLSNDEELLGRMDWQPTGRDHFFIRYFYQDDPYFNGGGSVTAGSWYNVPDTAHSVGGDWEHTFSPNWVNQTRYSFQQTSLLFQSGAQPNCTATTPASCTTSISLGGKLPSLTGNTSAYSSLGFGYATNIPQGRVVKVTQVQDNATWTTGKQTILFGGEFDYQNSPNPFLPDYSGGFSFSSFNDFISGTGALTLGNGVFSTKFTEPDYALYFQDDWKLRPDFTLNLGLRYEFFSQAVNILHNETVKRETNPATAFWDQTLPLSDRTFPYTNPAYKNFQPRVGFAWNPGDMKSRLVVRGGFAINFDPAFYNIFLNSATAAPVVNLGSISGCGTTRQCLPSSGASGAEVRALDLPYIPTGAGVNPGFRNTTYNSPNFHNPYTESYYLGVEAGLGSKASLEVKYVGNHQVGNFQSIDGNPYLLPIQQQFPSYANVTLCADQTQPGYGRPDCTHANVRTRTNGAFAIYNALQMQVKTREFHGLTSEWNYTYSRTIDNVSEIFSTFGGGNTIAFAENPLNTDQPERAVSGDSFTHDASAGFTYRLPFYSSGAHLMGKLLGGFQVNGIWTFNTGQPLSAYQYGFFGDGPDLQSYCSDTSFQNWQLSGYDVCRPVISNPKAPISTVGIYDSQGDICGNGVGYMNWANCEPTSPSAVHWLRNTQAVQNLTGGNNPYIGVGRNTLRGKAWNNTDASLYKTTKISERVSMQLQLIAYNVFNKQYLDDPDTGVDDVGGSFEDYRYNYGSNRNTQIGIKFLF